MPARSSRRNARPATPSRRAAPNRIGPNLYNVLGEPIAEGRNGYQFSAALSAHKDQKWDADSLNQWLTSPQSFAKGTKMTFAGLPKAQDRADVVAYLNSLSDSPKPLGEMMPGRRAA